MVEKPVCLIFILIKWPLDVPSSDYEISVGEKEAPMTAKFLLVEISLGFRDFYLPLSDSMHNTLKFIQLYSNMYA